MSILRTAASRAGEGLFFAFVHMPLMIALVVLVHVGNTATRRAAPFVAAAPTVFSARTSVTAVTYLTALVVAALVTPWWRPLLRWP